jgi:hypothetical protein
MRTLPLALGSILIGVAACSTPASQTRPVAASAACDQLVHTDRHVSDLFRSGNVYGSGDATEPRWVNQGPPQSTKVGAELYVHATPGMTAEFLQRELECYTVNGRSGHDNDPFHPAEGAVSSVAVTPSGDSYIVRILGSNDQAIADISKRARALTTTGTAQQVSRANGTETRF